MLFFRWFEGILVLNNWASLSNGPHRELGVRRRWGCWGFRETRLARSYSQIGGEAEIFEKAHKHV